MERVVEVNELKGGIFKFSKIVKILNPTHSINNQINNKLSTLLEANLAVSTRYLY